MFPLAVDSEWAIVGQEFTTLQPGDTVETFVAAGPGSGQKLPPEMTWRVRLRTGVYRTDMLGVPFSKDEVRHISSSDSDNEKGFPVTDRSRGLSRFHRLSAWLDGLL